ncbi:N/A [soil metagenome]
MARDPNSFLKLLKAPGNLSAYFVSKLVGEEWLSKPFHFTLTVRSHGDIPPVKDWIGAPITFGMAGSDGVQRKIAGQCVRLEQSYQRDSYVEFQIDVAPLFLRCKQRRDCRIFVDMSAKDIIEQLLLENGMYFNTVGVNYVDEDRAYCVQYWETDFDFMHRLMEEEGVYYFFKYDPAGGGLYEHIMYLADDETSYFDGAIPQITFREDEKHQGLKTIDLQHMQTTAAWVTHDYNYKKPRSLTPERTPTRLDYAETKTQFYQWPGKYDNMTSAHRMSKFGIELAEAASVVMSGEGTYMCFEPAARFEIIDKRLKPAERKIAIRSVKHFAHNPYSDQEGEFDYKQSFTAVPSYEPYHPPRITPKALVQGPQTAVVLDDVDPEGFGRVKVRFHWDTANTSTCWLRVAQQRAGGEVGAQWIPRIDNEVLVVFLEGDPDRPVIAAGLYNGDNKHPWEVPPNLAKSGWRTKSYPDGEITNEFLFDDKKDAEEIYTRAGRNLRREVIKDEDVDIGEFLKKKIGKDETREVGGQRTTKIKKDDITEIGGGQHTKMKEDQLIDVGGKSETLVKESAHLKVGRGLWVEVNDEIKIDSQATTHMVTQAAFTLESKTQLVFKVGGNQIEISPMGVTINGTLVKIN